MSTVPNNKTKYLNSEPMQLSFKTSSVMVPFICGLKFVLFTTNQTLWVLVIVLFMHRFTNTFTFVFKFYFNWWRSLFSQFIFIRRFSQNCGFSSARWWSHVLFKIRNRPVIFRWYQTCSIWKRLKTKHRIFFAWFYMADKVLHPFG